jgi:hypothetical protein
MPDEIPEVEQVFTRSNSAGTYAVLSLVAGLVALAFMVLGFCLSLVARTGVVTMHMTSTLPGIFAVMALFAAWSFARVPREVSVGPQGVSITRGQRTKWYRWDEIGWVTVATLGNTTRRRLVLFDTRGKSLDKIDEGLDGFSELVELVKKKIAEKGDTTAGAIRARQGRRSAIFIGSFATVMLFVCGAVAWITRSQEEAARELQARGVEGEAEIVRRFLAPNGVTPRLEYRVTTPGGRSGTRNAEVYRAVWNVLEGQTTVAVVYDPENPENSRLLSGEPPSEELSDKPGVAYALCVVMGIVCLGLWAVAVLHWKGWTIAMDAKTLLPSLKPFGTTG